MCVLPAYSTKRIVQIPALMAVPTAMADAAVVSQLRREPPLASSARTVRCEGGAG